MNEEHEHFRRRSFNSLRPLRPTPSLSPRSVKGMSENVRNQVSTIRNESKCRERVSVNWRGVMFLSVFCYASFPWLWLHTFKSVGIYRDDLYSDDSHVTFIWKKTYVLVSHKKYSWNLRLSPDVTYCFTITHWVIPFVLSGIRTDLKGIEKKKRVTELWTLHRTNTTRYSVFVLVTIMTPIRNGNTGTSFRWNSD